MTEWSELVKKTFTAGRQKNPKYQLKDAMSAAKLVYNKQGGSGSCGLMKGGVENKDDEDEDGNGEEVDEEEDGNAEVVKEGNGEEDETFKKDRVNELPRIGVKKKIDWNDYKTEGGKKKKRTKKHHKKTKGGKKSKSNHKKSRKHKKGSKSRRH